MDEEIENNTALKNVKYYENNIFKTKNEYKDVHDDLKEHIDICIYLKDL